MLDAKSWKIIFTLAAIGALTVASGILAALWWLLSHVQWVP